jgi:DNA-binding PadR family transcriptional regulator
MRLEQRGAIRGSWGVTENNRRARFYDITAAGRKHLEREKREWERMVGIMQALLSEPR